jgi:hypothetical protein
MELAGSVGIILKGKIVGDGRIASKENIIVRGRTDYPSSRERKVVEGGLCCIDSFIGECVAVSVHHHSTVVVSKGTAGCVSEVSVNAKG